VAAATREQVKVVTDVERLNRDHPRWLLPGDLGYHQAGDDERTKNG
jgi:hypothetical protein